MQKNSKNVSILWFTVFVLVSTIAYWLVGYHWKRAQAGQLILTFGVLFLGYGFVILQNWSAQWIKRWLWAAVGGRLLLILATPALSDDYFRFIWDGRLLAAGYNPYLYLPADIIHTSVGTVAKLNEMLYQGLNSPHYFTIYPPLNQLMFGVSAGVAGENLGWNITALRIFILAAEIGNIWLISHWRFPKYKEKTLSGAVLVYALNPFVVIELTGNLHFEAVTLFFVLLAVRWIDRPLRADKYNISSAAMLALAAAVKLLPLLFLPLVFKRLGFRKGIIYSLTVGSILLGLFLPFLSLELVINFGKSLDLYFQKFEFNGSFYYLLREMGYRATGYNIIHLLGPLLSMMTLVFVVWITFLRRSLLEKMLLSLTIYFLLATTVHPWYLTTLVAFGALTKRWYPVVWSALLPLTYITYASVPYRENMRIVALEYIVVLGCLGYELLLKGVDWEGLRKED